MIKTRKLLASASAILMVTSLTGCGSIFKTDATKVDLVNALSEKEVIDYYAKALSYDSIVTRDITVDVTKYETIEINDSDKVAKLRGLQLETEELLGENEYVHSKRNNELLDENSFNYIKAFLNDRKLENPKVVNMKEAIGHYFIDVEYEVKPREVGTFTSKASLLGINGAFVTKYTGEDMIDQSYINRSVSKLNKYYEENRISKTASWDSSVGKLSMTGADSKIEQDYTSTTMDDGEESSVSIPDITTNRVPTIDIEEFNRVAGSSKRETAYMPKLSIVFNSPTKEGTIGGVGIYPNGVNGLIKFQFNREQVSGKCILRYVYKDDVQDINSIKNTNVYPVSVLMDSGVGNINADITENLIIPEFLKTEFDKIIERADRAVINQDLTALMSGDIFTDNGVGVLTGYESNYTNVLRQVTSFRRLIARDTEQNAYLIEVERLRQEGAKGADVYGTYIDTGYMVIEQHGGKFYITDYYNTMREMRTEPDINPDSAVLKRLVALNLAGNIEESNKKEIESLLNELYQASTYRVLNGPKEISGVTLEKGMYDCFNSDVSLLSTTHKEYLNSELREQLVKYGINVGANMDGRVTSWIGGADKQAELITEELISYQGKGVGTVFEVYYLLSKMEDKWVIDERTVVSSEEVVGDALESTMQRLTK